MTIGMEKSVEKLKTVILTWKIKLFVTLIITSAFATFLVFHETQHLKFRLLLLLFAV